MSLLIVQGPDIAADGMPPVLPPRCAGHGVGRISCQDADAMAAALRAAPALGAVLVVIEPGGLRAASPALRRTLDALPVPYIELHADAGPDLDAWLHPRHGPMSVVVTPRDRARGYAMSLGIAARRLAATEAVQGGGTCRS